MPKRFLLVARYYSIEPLGILYLAGLVQQLPQWECKVVLVEEFDFGPLYEEIETWKPDMVGFQIWTGYHLPAFAACDKVRSMGVPVVIGGPHATYFDKECTAHADWVVKGSGFSFLRDILDGQSSPGVHFNRSGREEAFPLPDRDLVYRAYPALGASPIKSIFASVGCPMFCTYCYAPSFNAMHGGFKLTVRPVGEIIAEAQAILKRWPLEMVYFQDDIFGYDKRWLEEFAARWKQEVGVPFHCQIRLELTRLGAGDRRLDLFAQAGCTGITLAIESGNAFLRDHVLFRHMPDELIVDGCRKIMDRGMTLRTEQILSVPFSDTGTDLATLDLNNRINPTMAWTSILAPYGGTDMGAIASNFGLYTGNNDDLSDSFFDRSVLRHVGGGPREIEQAVQRTGAGPKDRAILKMKAQPNGGESANIVHDDLGNIGSFEFLDERENARYCESGVRLQRLFNWLAKLPEARKFGRSIVAIPEPEWNWETLGKATAQHLLTEVGAQRLEQNAHSLATEMGCESAHALPEPVARNPHYFSYFPAGGELAHMAVQQEVFSKPTLKETLDVLGTLTRRHLFHHGLYKLKSGRPSIAS
jgi:radical SAM superfamily enzyme YgiQ (UPF0313 family)